MPPFVGVAVKVTEVPIQTGFAEAAMLTLTGKFALTINAPDIALVADPQVPVTMQ